MEEKYPIMEYVHKLEGKVREAREDVFNYQKMAFLAMIKAVQFWVGVTVGGVIVGVPSLIYFGGKWLRVW